MGVLVGAAVLVQPAVVQRPVQTAVAVEPVEEEPGGGKGTLHLMAEQGHVAGGQGVEQQSAVVPAEQMALGLVLAAEVGGLVPGGGLAHQQHAGAHQLADEAGHPQHVMGQAGQIAQTDGVGPQICQGQQPRRPGVEGGGVLRGVGLQGQGQEDLPLPAGVSQTGQLLLAAFSVETQEIHAALRQIGQMLGHTGQGAGKTGGVHRHGQQVPAAIPAVVGGPALIQSSQLRRAGLPALAQQGGQTVPGSQIAVEVIPVQPGQLVAPALHAQVEEVGRGLRHRGGLGCGGGLHRSLGDGQGGGHHDGGTAAGDGGALVIQILLQGADHAPGMTGHGALAVVVFVHMESLLYDRHRRGRCGWIRRRQALQGRTNSYYYSTVPSILQPKRPFFVCYYH